MENPLARCAKRAKAADSISYAADQPAPFVEPKPKSKKRTLTQELADRVGNKENASSASNLQPAQVVADAATQPVQVAVDAAAKAVPVKRRLPRCLECKACLNRATGKQACEKNKAQRLAEQSSTIAPESVHLFWTSWFPVLLSSLCLALVSVDFVVTDVSRFES